MSRQCWIAEVKPEYMEQYIDIHVNVWPEIVRVIKESGVRDEQIYFYKNFSIVFWDCDDLEAAVKFQDATEIFEKWNTTIRPWLKGPFVTLKKIFDINEQLAGFLRQD